MEDIDSKTKKKKDISADSRQPPATEGYVLEEYDIIGDEHIDKTHHVPTKTETMEMEGENSKKMDEKISSRNRLSSSERSSSFADAQSVVVNYPRVNCKEKIVFCVDVSSDMDKPIFRSRAGDRLSSKHLVKKALSIFLQSKQKLDRKHEIGLILLHETATWAKDFTNNPRDILIAMEDIVDTQSYDTCDLGSVFDLIQERVDLPHVGGNAGTVPPPYTVRLILLYGRSNCPLQFNKKQSFNILNSSPYFFLDAVYLHEPVSEDNHCQEVFDTICDLDQKGLSYILDASRNPTKVYDALSQLLAHPLQRPVQNDASYRIGSSVPQPENG